MRVTYCAGGPDAASQIRNFWRQHWGDDFVVAHRIIYHPEDVDAFIAVQDGEWVGLITYKCQGKVCEIVSLDSLRERQGIGSRLIGKVAVEAARAGCQRLFLITTNDNLDALRFYQKRGFVLVRVYRGAIGESRKLKPSIPLIGEHGIPLRDEIELEMTL